MNRSRKAILAALVLLGPAPLVAQKTGVALTPFVGTTLFNRDLLLRPGLNAATDVEQQSLMVVVGARLNVGLTPSLELQGDMSVGSSGLKLTALSSPVGTDAKVTTMTGQVVYRTKSPIEPFSFTAHAGIGAVRRAFSERSGLPPTIANKTNVGAVLGGTLNFHMTARTALTIGIEDFLYNASFAVAAVGAQPAGTTKSITQNDLRISLGVRLAIVGQ